jgi:hypothetical protein
VGCFDDLVLDLRGGVDRRPVHDAAGAAGRAVVAGAGKVLMRGIGTRVRTVLCGVAVAGIAAAADVPALAAESVATVDHGVALVPVRCPTPSGCDGRLVLTVPSAALGGPVTVGSAHFTDSHGQEDAVRVRLDSIALSRLRAGGGHTQVTQVEHITRGPTLRDPLRLQDSP